MMFVPSAGVAPVFTGFTLILPAVSVGNVGQLAADLLIASLDMTRVGYLHTHCLIPVTGNDPYQTTSTLHTSAEVFSCAEQKLSVLQIRSPVLQTRLKTFRKLLVSWMKSSGFVRSVLLSSSHAHHRDDHQLLGSPLRYLLTPPLQESEGRRLEELGWRQMETVSVCPGEAEGRLSIPGGGVSRALYSDCCAEGVALAVVLVFCSEGDNIPDAFFLLDQLNQWLHLLGGAAAGGRVQWKVPPSWRLLFGSGVPPLLF